MALSVAFVVHSILMSDHLWGQIQLMWLCYGLNYVLATLFFWGTVTHKKMPCSLALCLWGQCIEVCCFLLLIYPNFKVDGIVGRDELSLFFVPYLISFLP
ncbi:MAG: hypothetical protein CM15mP83_0680 [Flavobacteriaceae bacterium]|nr:MAG: hypothetical protein CM15mP83_0680 [Flavobacteriaceae bacterium]